MSKVKPVGGDAVNELAGGICEDTSADGGGDAEEGPKTRSRVSDKLSSKFIEDSDAVVIPASYFAFGRGPVVKVMAGVSAAVFLFTAVISFENIPVDLGRGNVIMAMFNIGAGLGFLVLSVSYLLIPGLVSPHADRPLSKLGLGTRRVAQK